MPVDTSSYPTQPAKPFDPFALAGNIINLQRSSTENQILQQTLGSKEALGAAAAGAVRPDGTYDPQAYLRNAAANPLARYGLPDAASQAIAQRTGNAGATTAEAGANTAQTQNYQTRMAAYDAAMYPYLSGPTPNRAAAILAAQKVRDANPQLAGDYSTIISQIPHDNAQLKTFGDAFHARTLDPKGAADFLSPQPTIVNQGPHSTVMDTNPRTNKGLVGTIIPQGLSPEGAAAPQTGPTVGNQPTTITRQQALDIGMNKAQLINGQVVYGAGAQPGGVAPIVPGGAPTPPPRPAAVTQSVVPTGAPLGVEQNAATAGAGDAGQAIEFQKLANGAPDRKALLANMSQDLSKIQTGPLAAKINTAKSAANEIGGIVGVTPFDPEAIAAYDKFNKQAIQLATAQDAALGSDSRLSAFLHQNPNDALSTESNKQIIPLLQGREDALAAQNQAWQKTHVKDPSISFNSFKNYFNENYSPRAFQLPYMDPKQRAETIKSMSPQELDQVKSTWKAAIDNGWVKHPDSK